MAKYPPVAAVRLPWHPPAPAVPTAVLISLAALLVRVLVSVVPYSGQIRSPREAVSTLIFAAVWYPDLPELCDLRHIFAERYGNFFEHFVGQEVFAKKTVKFSVLDAMGLSSKPLHRGVKHDISCLSQDSYGAYISASCMDNSLRHDFKFLKVENLGNQLVQQKGKPKIEVYEKDRKKGAGALTTHARPRFLKINRLFVNSLCSVKKSKKTKGWIARVPSKAQNGIQKSVGQNGAVEPDTSWDIITSVDLWEDGGSYDGYVLVKQEDVVDVMTSFMAACLVSIKRTQGLAP
ncbi:hypothetical protein Zm00014a_044437 [Zea mays]|uniref:Uncharacterized protein n=1 Tax=Zea mays TaxID=4577 RepID=A0A3L6FUZ7_MAIZE|nr:hypothetical protein Zm00014a_044437 [Zea mays]